MKLSIIIVNYRSWDCLAQCLDSLLQETETQPWEIIVVDNCSKDGRMDEFQARFSGVRFLQSGRNNGFAYGCNKGAELASGETLLFLNPDVVVKPGSVSALLKTMTAHSNLAILTCGQLDGRGRQQKVFDTFPEGLTWFRTVKSLLRWLRPKRYPDPRQPLSGLIDCDWVSGSVFMIGRVAFDELGGWREDYWMYVEDCDFCLRAARRTMRVGCDGDVWMTHYHGGASRQTYAISVLTRTESIVSKHLYVQLNYTSLNRVFNHLCVFLAMVPKLLIYSILDLLTLRRIRLLKTRSDVFIGLMRHYGYVLKTGSWRSRQFRDDVSAG
ncbi:MAG TPA: glycosyltransferase family 2 protein [Xanthomonadales bacterium]|nr:glycosyltransferase family 2 protein [Xanthomonadales bacterium]